MAKEVIGSENAQPVQGVNIQIRAFEFQRGVSKKRLTGSTCVTVYRENLETAEKKVRRAFGGRRK